MNIHKYTEINYPNVFNQIIKNHRNLKLTPNNLFRYTSLGWDSLPCPNWYCAVILFIGTFKSLYGLNEWPYWWVKYLCSNSFYSGLWFALYALLKLDEHSFMLILLEIWISIFFQILRNLNLGKLELILISNLAFQASIDDPCFRETALTYPLSEGFR